MGYGIGGYDWDDRPGQPHRPPTGHPNRDRSRNKAQRVARKKQRRR